MEDQAYAKILLAKKGIQLDPEKVNEQIESRLSTMRQGKKGSTGWMIFYFAGSILGSILLTPFFVVIGIGMGWYYWKGTNLDPYGKRYALFDENTQLWGMIIFYMGMTTLVISLIYWIVFSHGQISFFDFPSFF